jgi:hypothetical protein
LKITSVKRAEHVLLAVQHLFCKCPLVHTPVLKVKQAKKQDIFDHKRKVIFATIHVCPIPIYFSSGFLLLKNANPHFLEVPVYLTFDVSP